jgi:hypothetical protein
MSPRLMKLHPNYVMTHVAARPPLPPVVIDRVVELTLAEPPGEVTHWTGRAMAAASGISLRSVPSKKSIVGTKRSCQTTRPCGCL